MNCPICKDIFYTKIENEKQYANCYLCLNCWAIFNELGKIIEKG